MAGRGPTAGDDAPSTGVSRRVVLLVDDGVLLLSLGACSVFSAAGRELAARGDTGAPYAVTLVSPSGGPIRTTCGLALSTQPIAAEAAIDIDTLVIAGGRGIEQAATRPPFVDWLSGAAARAARTLCLGKGAFALAATGQLAGRDCATHWLWAADLQHRHPTIRVRGDRLFARDGPYLTAAGASGSIDAALDIVEEDLGRPLATAVARSLLLARRRPADQPQLSAELLALDAVSSRIVAAARWMVDNLGRNLRVGEVACRYAMSERNFSRQFRREVGVTPQQFIERARLEAVRRWLAGSSLPIDKIARRTGFSSGDHVARAFARRFGMSPVAYRRSLS